MSTLNAAVLVTGKVQGVFYRLNTKQKAEELGIRGWVRNLPDGSVEAFFQGPTAAVKQMIEWCWKGPEAANVNNVKVDWVSSENQYTDFQVLD